MISIREEDIMSRTYRKRIDLPYCYDFYTKEIDNSWIKYGGKNNNKYEAQEIAKHYTDNGYKSYSIDKGPKWFKKLYMIRPHRAKETHLLKNVKKLIDYENAPEFPLARKPKEYWW